MIYNELPDTDVVTYIDTFAHFTRATLSDSGDVSSKYIYIFGRCYSNTQQQELLFQIDDFIGQGVTRGAGYRRLEAYA